MLTEVTLRPSNGLKLPSFSLNRLFSVPVLSLGMKSGVHMFIRATRIRREGGRGEKPLVQALKKEKRKGPGACSLTS